MQSKASEPVLDQQSIVYTTQACAEDLEAKAREKKALLRSEAALQPAKCMLTRKRNDPKSRSPTHGSFFSRLGSVSESSADWSAPAISSPLPQDGRRLSSPSGSVARSVAAGQRACECWRRACASAIPIFRLVRRLLVCSLMPPGGAPAVCLFASVISAGPAFFSLAFFLVFPGLLSSVCVCVCVFFSL